MDTYNPQRLPFFPTPYPGESLYSVLCRYHIRSGNATTRKTILQLFGSFGSLCSTLLLPSMLYCFDSWTASGNTVDAEKLLWNHTAYSLCALKTFSRYEWLFSEKHKPHLFSKRLSLGAFQQSLIQHPSDTLRYCPLCAKAQKKLYGESYWQIVPQLDGVEYCTIHRTRIAATTIRTRDLLYSFYPADVVLSDVSPDYPVVGSLWYHSVPIAYFPELFVAMAKTVSYLWKHLSSYSGIWTLLHRYRLLLAPNNEFWQMSECVRAKLIKQNASPLVNWLISNIANPFDNRFFFPSSFSLSEHAMLISMLSPSPQAFFNVQ